MEGSSPMSVHDIPPVTEHLNTCNCLICYCLKRQSARAARQNFRAARAILARRTEQTKT